jgi:hypothetical protein
VPSDVTEEDVMKFVGDIAWVSKVSFTKYVFPSVWLSDDSTEMTLIRNV